MSSVVFPLLVVQPVSGAGPQGAGVRVLGAESAGAADLSRLFDEFGLAQAASGLPCFLPDATLARLDAARLPAELVLQPDPGEPTPVAPPRQTGKGPTQALLLKILAQITSDAETRDIEATLRQDPQLSVQLLRLVNSAAFAPTTRINSFAHAITLLGRRQLQRWLQLLLYASQSSGTGINPVMTRAAMRAALMEGLCKSIGQDRATQDEAFMVGMFSLLDVLFAQPLASIIEPLKLVEEIRAALLERRGKLGELLVLVEASDQGPEAVEAPLARLAASREAWCRAQVEALRWALRISQEP